MKGIEYSLSPVLHSQSITENNKSTLTATCLSIGKSTYQDPFQFLNMDLYYQIFTDNIHSIVLVNKNYQLIIENDSILKSRLIQSKITNKLIAILPNLTDGWFRIRVLSSIAERNIMMGSTDYSYLDKAKKEALKCTEDDDWEEWYDDCHEPLGKILMRFDANESIKYFYSLFDVTENSDDNLPLMITFNKLARLSNDPLTAKKFLDESVKCMTLMESEDYTGECERDLKTFIDNVKLMTSSTQDRIEKFSKVLETSIYWIDKIYLSCAIAREQAQGNLEEAKKTIANQVSHGVSNLNIPGSIHINSPNSIFNKIAKCLGTIDLELFYLATFCSEKLNKPEIESMMLKNMYNSACDLLSDKIEENSKRAIVIQKIIKFFNSLDRKQLDIVKKEGRIENEIASTYASLTIQDFNESLKSVTSAQNQFSIFHTHLEEITKRINVINDPYIKCCFLLEISAAIKPSEGIDEEHWLALKREILAIAVKIIPKLEIHDNEEKVRLWHLIYKAEVGLNLNTVNDTQNILLEAINQLKPNKRVDAIIHLAALTKNPGLIKLAIEITLVASKEFAKAIYENAKNRDRTKNFVYDDVSFLDYFSKIANLDSNQIPYLLNCIKANQWIRSGGQPPIIIAEDQYEAMARFLIDLDSK